MGCVMCSCAEFCIMHMSYFCGISDSLNIHAVPSSMLDD